ncbi:MAG: hypothetical protein ACOCUF_02865 [Patescibacteria group bacterium]
MKYSPHFFKEVVLFFGKGEKERLFVFINLPQSLFKKEGGEKV